MTESTTEVTKFDAQRSRERLPAADELENIYL